MEPGGNEEPLVLDRIFAFLFETLHYSQKSMEKRKLSVRRAQRGQRLIPAFSQEHALRWEQRGEPRLLANHYC